MGFGNTLSYKCKPGYEGQNRSKYIQFTCGNNYGMRNWVPDWLSDCVIVDCGSFNPIENGLVSFPEGYINGSLSYHSCQSDFELVGSNTSKCQMNGEWSIKPICRRYQCEPPVEVLNSTNTTTNNLKVGSEMTFECITGNVLLGSKTRRCLANGSWDGAPTDCKCNYFQKFIYQLFKLLNFKCYLCPIYSCCLRIIS